MALFNDTKSVTARLGVHHSTLADLCKRAGVKPSVWPSSTGSRQYKYTEAQIVLLESALKNPKTSGKHTARHPACHRSTFFRKTS